jgi:hypothetical protein
VKENYWLRLLIVGSIVLFPHATASLSAEKRNVSASERHASAVFDVLLPLVYSSGKPVRLYYDGACSSDDWPVPFPQTKVKALAKGKSGSSAFRDIFANDANVTVTEGRGGIIRMWVGKVPTEIL